MPRLLMSRPKAALVSTRASNAECRAISVDTSSLRPNFNARQSLVILSHKLRTFKGVGAKLEPLPRHFNVSPPCTRTLTPGNMTCGFVRLTSNAPCPNFGPQSDLATLSRR